jgi:hypothetical protein
MSIDHLNPDDLKNNLLHMQSDVDFSTPEGINKDRIGSAKECQRPVGP